MSAVETPGVFIFLTLLKKNIPLFGGELLLRQFSIQSINKFLEKLWLKPT